MDTIQKPRTDRRRSRSVPQRHRWFNPWLVATGQGLAQLVSSVLRSVEDYEKQSKARRRRRSSADQRSHERRIEAVVCNLVQATLFPGDTGRLAVTLGHGGKGRSRYDSEVIAKTLSPLLNILDELGVLHVYAPSTVRGEASSIEPTAAFKRTVVEAGIDAMDIGRDARMETIILGTKDGYGRKHRLEYLDTPKTKAFRAEVEQLNDTLKLADICFCDDGLTPVDVNDRALRRHFVALPGREPCFELGGRLFGGFWQNLQKARRASIRLAGEEVVELDYSSMFPRLAFAEIGIPAPLDDIYAIPGLEGYRSGAKMAMNVLLFDQTQHRQSWPSDLGVGVGNDEEAVADPASEAARFEARLPARWGVSKFKSEVLKCHPRLREAWGRGLGYTLMFRESQVLLGVLKRLARKKIVALPIHDSLLVPRSAAALVRQEMIDEGYKQVGAVIPVK